jgi:diguanylate cyclase (GGDEF)-like protein/PAS domain S-box-containing protein
MDDFFKQVLDIAEIGIVIVDSEFHILVWNEYIEKISAIKRKEAVNNKLGEVCTTFAQPRYRDMIESVTLKQQCRFCSSKLHRAFFYPKNVYDEMIRQNMTIIPIVSQSEIYILIQIVDITYLVNSEHKLTSLLSEMTKGYNDVRESEEINKRLAVTDLLTGLHNRVALMQNINNIIRNRANLTEYALMFLDLDGFKRINDTLGHDIGDKLLVKTAEKIRMSVRNDDAIARFGGDEFVVLIKSNSGRDGAEIVAKKLVAELAKPFVVEGKIIRVTCSVGVAMLGNESNPEEIIKKADTAMYLSKNNGKNRYTFFTEVGSVE